MTRSLSAFPHHYLAACIVNALAVVALPTLGLRVIAARLGDAWLLSTMALLVAGWALGIGILEAALLHRAGIRPPRHGFARLVAGFLCGGLFAFVGYLLAAGALTPVGVEQAPSWTAVVLLLAFGVAGICCWALGLILPLVALRPYLGQ